MFGRRLERLERQESHLNDKQQRRSQREDQISREAEEKYHRLLGDDYSEPVEELPELSNEEAQEIYDKLFD